MHDPVSVGQLVSNKYRIESILGAGGMGIVAEGLHIELSLRVALKFLRPELGGVDVAARFRHEALALARLRSEHVTRVIDIGRLDNGIPYIVMEFLEGTDLAQELSESGPLPVAVAIDYLLQAIDALAEAHAVGIVHRDLKPANLFIARRADGSKIVKILDFGVAKSLTPDEDQDLGLTRATMQIGSPMYMSPEQMRSPALVDQRTDIWALGIILYRALTGELPFAGQKYLELQAAGKPARLRRSGRHGWWQAGSPNPAQPDVAESP